MCTETRKNSWDNKMYYEHRPPSEYSPKFALQELCSVQRCNGIIVKTDANQFQFMHKSRTF